MMNTTVDFRPQSFECWIRLADRHLSTANLLAQSAPEHAAFWCHQAAERYLKACLVRRAKGFDNSVTDLRSLLEIYCALEPRHAPNDERVANLEMPGRMSAWETAFAYPPGPEETDLEVPGPAELRAVWGICEGLRELALQDYSEGGDSDEQR